MNSSTLPIFCGISLAAMAAAGASHWWSVDQWVSAYPANLPLPGPQQPMKKPAEPLAPAPNPELASLQKHPTPDSNQKNFYEALIQKMGDFENRNRNMENQNKDLIDQMAETNRDVVRLQFQVDTHSESFRPMPTSEDRADTSFDDGPGVLPPRAELVLPESNE